MYFLAVCLVVSLPAALGYGSGAPAGACVTLTPGHTGLSPQESASPYTLEIVGGQTNFAAGTQTIKLKVTGRGYGGFLFQVRQGEATTPLGTWTASDKSKLLQCGDNAASSLTQNGEYPGKTDADEFTWNVPDGAQGTYKFVGTVAENHDNYWVKIESAAFTIGDATTDPTPNDQTTSGSKATCFGVSSIAIFVASLWALLLK